MACPLGRDLIGGLARYLYTQMNEDEAKQEFFSEYNPYFDLSKPDHSRLHLRFGHAESLLPLYNLFIMKQIKNNSLSLKLECTTIIQDIIIFQMTIIFS